MQQFIRSLSRLWLWVLALLFAHLTQAQVSITSGTLTYSQDFNGLASTGTANTWTNNTTLPGWLSTQTTYRASTGSDNAGALYSFGSASAAERALGSTASGSAAPQYGVVFTNNTGSSLTSLRVSYTGEQWRNGGNADAQKLTFSYATGTGLTIASAGTNVPALDFTSPVVGATIAALNGNDAANQVFIQQTITFATPLVAGQEVLLKWSDANDAGNDHGLGVDNLTVMATVQNTVPSLTVAPVTLSGFSTTQGTASATQTYALSGSTLSADVTITAPAGYEVSQDGTTFQNSITVVRSNGSVNATIRVRLTGAVSGTFSGNVTNVSGSTSANVAVSGQVNAAGSPTLTASPMTLSGFATTQGTASAPQTFTVSGSSLSPSSITVTASQGIEISLNPTTDGYTNRFTFSNLPSTFNVQVYARLTATAAVGPVNGSVSVMGSNNTSANVAVSGTVNAPVTITLISQIQGSGSTAALTGTQTIEAIVTRVFSGSTRLNGFYVQEEDADSDNNPATSEGIFVYDPSGFFTGSVGSKVRITGTVSEFTSTASGNTSNLTQITLANANGLIIVSNTNPSPTVTNVQLPVANVSDLEQYEGMLVNMSAASGNLAVTEYFQLGRFGQVVLSATGSTDQPNTDPRLDQYTQFFAPSISGYAAYLADADKRTIILDDGSTVQNPDPIIFGRGGQPLSASNTLRGGDQVASITAVLDQRLEGYRLQTTNGTDANFIVSNPRPATPPVVNGTLKAGSFNVLNYFNTLGTGNFATCAGNSIAARGASNSTEFTRQRDKVIRAIVTSGVDVMSLNEMQNNGFGTNSAIQDLINGLNAVAGANSYTFVNSGCISTDAITVAMIYKPAKVTLVGASAAIPASYGNGAFGVVGRRALAQTFRQSDNGAVFTLVANHWKSKGSSSGGTGDADANDGQSASNGTRTRQAQDLVSWLATNPTGTTDPDYLIVGDLNSYAKEDPLTTLEQGGYTNLVPNTTYSYVFDGFVGALDHALRSASLQSQVAGADKWHINSDEPIILDYNTEFKSAGQVSSLYSSEPYRASDHDPVLIGLSLTPATVSSLTVTATANPNQILTTGSTTITASVMGGTSPYSYAFTGPGVITPNGNTASVSGLSAGVQTFTVTATDATTPTAQTSFTTVSVTVTQANTAPVATANNNQTGTVGTAFTYTVNAFTDAETPNNLTYAAVINPANGLSFNPATRIISGTPTMTGVSSVTITATDPGSLSASTTFTITVNPAPVAALTVTASADPTQILTTGSTTLTGMVMGGTAPYGYAFTGPGVITPNGNTASVSGLSAGVQTFTVTVTDATTPTAQTSFTTVSVSVTQANTAPTVANAVSPQSATVGTAYMLSIANVFTDAETPNQLTLSASGLPMGLSLSGSTISGTPSMSGVSTVTLTATDPGNLSATNSFMLTVSPMMTPTPTGPFSITGVTLVSCTTLSVGERQISFSPQYAGQDGSPVSFSVVNELSATTAPGPYSLKLYTDNPMITLSATQSGTTSLLGYNWLAACNATTPAPTNTAPTVANPVSPQSATVGTAYTLSIANVFTDAETPNQLTLSASGLPMGLSLSGSTISGTPSMSGVSTVTLTATDPGTLSTSTQFTLTVNPALTTTPTPTGPFSITGVTLVSCTTLSVGERQISFSPQYAGQDGSPVSFSVVNELSATTAPGPYSLKLYTDNPVITLSATQSGTTSLLGYNWLAACNATTPAPTNTAPTVANPVSPQSATVGTAYTLSVANVFTDAETPNQLTLSASGLPMGLSLSGTTISGTPSMSGVSTVTLTATDPGTLSTSTQFTLTVNPASTTPPTAPFSITAVTLNSCQTLSAGERQITFTPQYAGVTGEMISFRVVNESQSTTAPGPYTLKLYTDNPVINLRAMQGSGSEVAYAYNWLAACNTNGRVGVAESTMEIRVIGNPIHDGQASVEVRGVSGQSLTMVLTDMQGQTVGQHQVEQAGSVEAHTFAVGRQPVGTLLLRVTTPTQAQTVKLLKVN